MKTYDRKNGFLGVHFDFHASRDNRHIGKSFTEKTVQDVIDMLHPDYIQCDTKGAYGIASYPTRLENRAPEIDKDILKIWRKVTKENGVGLFAHHAAMDDRDAAERHPDWALMRADGSLDPRLLNIPGDYIEKRLIPQLLELAGDYELDGAWMDGSGFNIEPNYRPEILARFTEKTGITEIPKNENDPHYAEFLQFFRDEYAETRRHYINAVHEKYPDFQICCNWDYTSYDSEKVDSDISFISADIWGMTTFNILRMECRFISGQKKPWDLMLWCDAAKYAGGFVNCLKPSVQLMHEASQIMMHGGGVELYMLQEPDGGVDIKKLDKFKETFDYCRKYREYLFGSESLSQIAVLFDGKTAMKMNNKAYGFFEGSLLDGINGILQCFADSQQSVDVIGEWELDNPALRYKLIVVPEWSEFSCKDKLLAFAENGGSLLIIGSGATKLFEKELGVSITDTVKQKRVFIGDKYDYCSFGELSDINEVKVLTAVAAENAFLNSDFSDIHTALTVNGLGKGKIAGIYFDMGQQYISGRTAGACDFVKRTVSKLLQKPELTVIGSRNIEVALRRNCGKKEVVLLNCSGPHSDPNTFTYDELLPICDITVKVKTENKPEKVVRQPENLQLDFEWDGEYTVVKLEKLEMMSVITLD